MADLGKAYVQIIPKATGISDKIKEQVSPGAGSAGKAAGTSFVGKFAKIAGGAAIGAVVAKGLKTALDEGARVQQSFGGLDTLYGDASEAAKNYAKEAANAGISMNDYAEQAVSFGASLKAAFEGDTAAAAEAANTAILDMADNAAKMGTPLENIQNAYQGFAKQNYTMLDNLKLGYGGTKSEMERLLSDATKLSGVEYNMDNLGDVYEAIHVIQEDLGLTGVAAQEAATTFSGSFGAMKASAANFLADLTTGGDVEASMTQMLTSVGTFIFGNLVPMVWSLVQALPAALSTAIKVGAQAVMTEGPGLVNSLITGIQTNVPLLIERGKVLALSVRDGIVQNAPILLEQAKALIEDYSNKIAEAAPQLLDRGKDLLISLGNGILENIPVLSENVVNVIDSIGGMIQDKLPTFATTVAGILERKIPVVAGAILRGAPVVLRAVTNIGMSMLRNLTALIPQVARAGLTIIAGLARGIGGSAVGLVRAAMNRIKQAMEQPIEQAKNTLNGIIENIKGFFPINVGRILDNISLPHFTVNGGQWPYGIGGRGYMPSFDVSWWAEGGIMTKPVLFGGGEAGHEGIIPLDPFWKKMDKIAENTRGGTVINITVNGAESPELWATRFAREYKMQARTV